MWYYAVSASPSGHNLIPTIMQLLLIKEFLVGLPQISAAEDWPGTSEYFEWYLAVQEFKVTKYRISKNNKTLNLNARVLDRSAPENQIWVESYERQQTIQNDRFEKQSCKKKKACMGKYLQACLGRNSEHLFGLQLVKGLGDLKPTAFRSSLRTGPKDLERESGSCASVRFTWTFGPKSASHS